MTSSSGKSQSGLERLLNSNRKEIIVVGIDECGVINLWNESIAEILG